MMQAIVLNTDTHSLSLQEREEPKLQTPLDIKLKVLEVGICGTDREEAKGLHGAPTAGKNELIIGHEMLGQVIEVGAAVKDVQIGELATFTVRRGCKQCMACKMDRPDLCYTGHYLERGIKGYDGYQTEFVVDHAKFLVRIPQTMRELGVLAEPFSVVEKAIDDINILQGARLVDWTVSEGFKGKIGLVVGLGPIGLLAAIALRLREVEVFGLDIVDRCTARPQILEQIGGHYINGQHLSPNQIEKHYGRVDFILEAAGIAKLDFSLFNVLGANSLYVLTGITHSSQLVNVEGGTLMKQLVLNNQLIVGSVNAAKKHWERGIQDLQEGISRWPSIMRQLITQKTSYQDFHDIILKHPNNEIKSVILWE